MANTLILEIYDGDTVYSMSKQNRKAEIKLEAEDYLMSIQDISFHKKMYTPGEILADIQFSLKAGTEWKKISKDKLEKAFLNKKVNLLYGSQTKDVNGAKDGKDNKAEWTTKAVTVCSGYYIGSLDLCYKPNSMFVTMKMYSPDKVMTLKKDCHSFVAERLCRDILDKKVPPFPLPFNKDQNLAYDYENLTNLKVDGNSKEAIFPYLVQYNESFYDFLVRTTNRWGEFLYYEDDKLHIGFKNDTKQVKTWDTVTYYEEEEDNKNILESIGNFDTAAVYDKHMLDNSVEKSHYAKLFGVMTCGLKEGGDLWGMKIIGNLLSSGKNIFDFFVDTVVDEGIATAQAKIKVSADNEKFDNENFNPKDITDAKRAQYDDSLVKYNPYAEYKPHLDSTLYKKVLTGELHASQNMVNIDFDTEYQHLPLGQVITIGVETDQYIVVESGTKKKTLQGIKKVKVEKEGHTEETYELTSTVTTVYYVQAIKADSGTFYPTIHPAGHIRQSGPQPAKITNISDPTRQGRVRVKFDWQGEKDADSPFLVFARPAAIKDAGTYNFHYVDELVLVEFANGNVERPYVVGSLPMNGQTVPIQTYKNDYVHRTPGGQAILMTDGTKSNSSSMLSGLFPSLKVLMGFFPDKVIYPIKDDDAFEGNVEICDKYGFYSIKGSTDGRNVTIKSPFGDVKINAFTGITISAPNGDVKIQGKNVTIEAGNNLTLTSGKNIKDKFLHTDYGIGSGKMGAWQNAGTTFAAAITKKVASMVGGFFDISIIRSVVEVFYRPVEGKMQLKSNRYLALEAGQGKTAYPVDAYNHPNRHHNFKDAITGAIPKKDRKTLFDSYEAVMRAFNAVPQIVDPLIETYVAAYNQAQASVTSLKRHIARSSKMGNQPVLPCKMWTNILDDLWSNPQQDIDTVIGFNGKLADRTDQEMGSVEFIKMFLPNYTGQEADKIKTAAKSKAAKKFMLERQAIKDDVQSIANAMASISNLSKKAIINHRTDISDNIKTALKNVALPEEIKRSNPAVKYFAVTIDENGMRNLKKRMRRAHFIALVNVLEIPREPVLQLENGGAFNAVNVNQQVPPAPDPSAPDIEDAWGKYVDSIQHLYKEEKSLFKTAIVSSFDPLISSWTGLLDDVFDRLAFGSSKRGEILFSSGGATQVLGPEIKKANVREVDAPDYVETKSKAYATDIRNIMKQEP